MQLKRLPKPTLAMEMIAYQDERFGRDLEREVNSIIAGINDGTYNKPADLSRAPEVLNIEKLIYTRTGLKVTTDVNSHLAAVIPLYVNKNHIFIPKHFRANFDIKDQTKLIKQMEATKGWVDTKTAKVGGVFSEYNHSLYMNYYVLCSFFKMEARYVVAILLHELGHAYSALEYSDRLSSNNQVLADVSKLLSTKDAYKKKDYIYKELRSINSKVTEEDVDVLLSDRALVPGTKWMEVVVGSVTQQLSDDKYDETSFEQLADGFAARFGYGREIVEGLDRLYKVYPTAETSVTLYRMSRMMETFSMLCYGVLILSSLVVGAIPVTIVTSTLLVISLLAHNTRFQYKTYDDLRDRYKRIRQQYIHLIKDLELDKATLATVVEDIHAMDEIMEATRNYRSLYTIVSNFVIRTGAKADASVVSQQLAEELAMNDLYLKSAEFKLIA